MSRFISLLSLVVLIGSLAGFAQAKAYVDAEEAAEHPDFAVQGEYVGTYVGEDGEARVGLQVRTSGDGGFTALAYPGGLPGEGWTGDEPLPSKTTRDADENVSLPFGPYAARFEGDSFVVSNAAGSDVGKLEPVFRESPNAGKKAPEGAIVLFDGSNVDQLRDGRMTEDGLLIEGATSLLEFEDATIHLEFKIPFMPDGSAENRANSGVYIQNRYEVQILDTFGQLPPKNGMAALYRQRAADLNMTFPPLQWQTYDIKFTAPRFDETGEKTANARFTVIHNGVVVHDDVELPHGTGAGQARGEGGPGPLHLQDHGAPVRYRNVWIRQD
ncbi:MAG: DUF1080 domain-containing protein [Phycisphaeraceae bacterium]